MVLPSKESVKSMGKAIVTQVTPPKGTAPTKRKVGVSDQCTRNDSEDNAVGFWDIVIF